MTSFEMNKEEITNKIAELETELEEFEFGSCTYDFIDAELQDLYCKLDRLNDWATDIDY